MLVLGQRTIFNPIVLSAFAPRSFPFSYDRSFAADL
jgi:hypothetical protein